MPVPVPVPSPALVLAVIRGPGAGARMHVDATTRVVGRGRDADFVVLDARVSRRHLDVTAVEGGVRVRALDGAEPFLVRGTPQRDVVLRSGDTIVIGDTALTLEPAAAAQGDDSVRTDVRALMTGLAADVRGLTAAMELIEALDAADDDAAIAAALRAWGARHANARDVSLEPRDGGGVDDVPCLVERRGADGPTILLSAPAHSGSGPLSVTFACASTDGGVTDTTRRLVAVAARLAGSALVRVGWHRRADEERELARSVTLGSARSFLGDSPAAREIAKLVTRLAASETVVLLEGETGVGKTFLARLLHETGPRAKGPLRVINCAAIPHTLIESELFGHERGAFTGAATARAGALESAAGGTVLLDEIGELPLGSQAKLLRVLEEKRFERLGSNRTRQLEARVLVATNRDLEQDAKEGSFRSDLYYRIAVLKLRVPALRDRGEDLVLLAHRMLDDLAPSAGRRIEGFAPETLDVVRRYPWPGNVRELRNAIERALVVGDTPLIQPRDLPDALHGAPPSQPDDASLVRLPMRMDLLEQRAIEAALRAGNGNQRKAAALLGINRVTLNRKLRGAAAGKSVDVDDE